MTKKRRTDGDIDGMSSLSGTMERSTILRMPAFIRYLGARSASMIAYQILSVAVSWQMYSLTNSALYLGLVGLMQFLPMLLLTLVVGYVADRFDRRVIACICQFVESIAVSTLAWGSHTGSIGESGILVIVFVIGAVHAFEGPTMYALVPGIVPMRFIAPATAWSASAMQTAVILGPALGGFLYHAGPAIVYVIVSILFLSSSVLLALIRTEAQQKMFETKTRAALFEGIMFIRARPDILGAISLDMFAVLLGGATALLPIYARDILIVGPKGLGFLRSAPAIGALVMSVYLARSPLKHQVGRRMFSAVGVFGAATIVFGLSKSFPLSLLALTILGASDVISVVIRQALIQIATPDKMRGRVSAVNSLFVGTSNQLGEFESGIMAHWFGTVPAVLLGGIGTIIVLLVWKRVFPQLLHVENLDSYRCEEVSVTRNEKCNRRTR